MMIHLREITNDRGDVVEHCWYCSETCYSDSLTSDPPNKTLEEGGAYPCGAESDVPDYCAQCGSTVGNPLTDSGEQYVKDFVDDVFTDIHSPFRAERIEIARQLKSEYSYLFPSF